MNRVEQHYVDKVWKNFQTKEPFKSWLESKPPESIVGVSKSSDSCPIAQYCKDLGIPAKEVTWGHIDIDYGGNRTFAVLGVDQHGNDQDGVLTTGESLWLVDFIVDVDDYYKDDISAAESLDLLELSGD